MQRLRCASDQGKDYPSVCIGRTARVLYGTQWRQYVKARTITDRVSE